MDNVYITSSAIRDIPEKYLPLFVLSDKLNSPFSFAVKRHESGFYNHCMWYHRPGYFASQDWIFHEVPVTQYLKTHRLKFWTNLGWTKFQRLIIRARIEMALNKPWWKRLYDPVGLVGQALNLNWLQIPGFDICSDKGRFFRYVDRGYKLAHPSPPDVNRWLKENKNPGYTVFAVYDPDLG